MARRYFGFLVVATTKSKRRVYLEAKDGEDSYVLLQNEDFLENVIYIDLLARYISKEITWEKYMSTIYRRAKSIASKKRIYVTWETVKFLELQKKMV